jgi:hypothetical protein
MQDNPIEPVPPQAPPIPLPEALVPGPAPREALQCWEAAPLVVRSWAYTWSFLAMWISAFLGALLWLGAESFATKSWRTLLCLLIFVISHLQRKGLKNGGKIAWKTQIVLSLLGLIWFPIGTVIHGYILSQWFRREVRAWFGQR